MSRWLVGAPAALAVVLLAVAVPGTPSNLRLPEGEGPFPTIVFVHGGCWLAQFDIGHAAPLEQALADAGYAVWSIEYRKVGDEGGGWPATFEPTTSTWPAVLDALAARR